LRDAGALERILPELARLWGVPQRADYHPEVDTGVHVMMVLDFAAAQGYSLPVRFAALTHDLGKGTTPDDVLPRHIGHEGRSVDLLGPLCARLRVPVECRELAQVVAREHGNIHASGKFGASALVRLLERCDALRKPERFVEILQACEADARGRGGDFPNAPYVQRDRLMAALAAARSVDAGAVARQYADNPTKIREAVQAARIEAVEAAGLGAQDS
jgi:tRNA nucleotidyltransferase (CCA-adding enzyme)